MLEPELAQVGLVLVVALEVRVVGPVAVIPQGIIPLQVSGQVHSYIAQVNVVNIPRGRFLSPDEVKSLTQQAAHTMVGEVVKSRYANNLMRQMKPELRAEVTRRMQLHITRGLTEDEAVLLVIEGMVSEVLRREVKPRMQ